MLLETWRASTWRESGSWNTPRRPRSRSTASKRTAPCPLQDCLHPTSTLHRVLLLFYHYLSSNYSFSYDQIHYFTICSFTKKTCLTNKNRSAIWMHCCCKDAPFASSPSFLQRNHDPCALFYCSRLFLIHFIDLFIDFNNFTDFPSMFLICNLSRFGWFNVSWVCGAVLVC